MMDNNETIADIIAEARDKYTVHECSQCTWRKCCSKGFGSEECGKLRESIWLKFGIEDGYFAQLLDRLEAAHKRELSKIVSKNGSDFGQLGDAAKLRELFTKNRETDNSGAAIYTNDNSGDCAKMREALQQAKVAILAARKKMGVDNPIILEIIDAALAAPPRNCDVGTAGEQAERYMNFFCRKYPKCTGCPCVGQVKYNQCEFAWLQLPYEDGETGGGSHGSRNGERKAQLAGVAREAVC